jgi:oxygen-independent coproporphyrinogen-3 oxidase
MKGEPIQTIFIGGGTPTALSASQLDRLLEGINLELHSTNKLVEFAVEANPGELSLDKLSVLKNAGVNRLSIGVQSFNDDLLQRIGRVHRKEDVFRTILQAEQVGFENLSIDLMYGLPGQTLEDFHETLKTAFTLNVKHYSAYSLIVEPKTVFYNLMQKGRLTLPPQEQEAQMYELTMELMENSGFKQYEISNYSIPGYESIHNLTYWNNNYYFGFGAGAHGYLNGMRTSNIGPIKKYMENIQQTGEAFNSRHVVSKNEEMEEEMFLGLRKTDGVSKGKFSEKFHVPLTDVFSEQINKLVNLGLIVNDEQAIRLTNKGKLLGNEVFQEFIGLDES